ncbi:MAG: hypothetical protein ACOYM3_01185 [Terrimicrobiaceae bacterium]
MNRWDILVIIGIFLIATGAALIYVPAGLIVAGVGMAGLGIAGAMTGARRNDGARSNKS